ncbi:hypothetical protein K1X76_09710 [bacterium]|nr:hypothetical protein [bacterium]
MIKDVLKTIVASPHLEARWLNTLSLLERIGARKISKTVCETHPKAHVLKHLADESRHAFAFKQLSENVMKGEEGMICEEEAISYFQMLDASLAEWLSDVLRGSYNSYASYLLTTTMIERRAMKMYPLYRSMTSSEVVKDELQKIILEEADHKPQIEEETESLLKNYGYTLDDPEKIENKLYRVFEHALEKAVA